MNRLPLYCAALGLMIGVNALAMLTTNEGQAHAGPTTALATSPASSQSPIPRSVATKATSKAKEWRSVGAAANGYQKPGTGIALNYAIESLEQIGDSSLLETELVIENTIDFLSISLSGEGISVLSTPVWEYRALTPGTTINMPVQILADADGEQKLIVSMRTQHQGAEALDVFSIPVEVGYIIEKSSSSQTSILNGEEVVAMELNIP